ncbi:OLD family endonuclease [Paenibacillus macquariensis subsp. defensor]|nr:OLD family endonuclease [Paenibacillus macquariensis subsp. defensor]
MELLCYRVRDFRSIEDSGWIETEEITSFIGTNESGKTNLLVPLWKFNPAKDGEINPIQDYPRNRYGIIREMRTKPIFIEVRFRLDDELILTIADLTSRHPEELSEVIVSRDYSGNYHLIFPHITQNIRPKTKDIIEICTSAFQDIQSLECAVKAEDQIKNEILLSLNQDKFSLGDYEGYVSIEDLRRIKKNFDSIDLTKGAKRSTIVPRFGQVIDRFEETISFLEMPLPEENSGVIQTVIENLPKFVYYSNYGNLDSEIYLPQIIENMTRLDVGIKEGAKARTLKVLFDFVRLKPQEILDLGKDFQLGSNPSDQQIKDVAENKKERDILLQSAGTELTGKFRDWWKQGDYRFRFQADGNYFRIWVSDDKRPEDIELESRSTGLQWFLSFYLVFLVEGQGSHKNSVLLLDEPGVSLHPIAQRDLAIFFENLATTNQLLYTTHSPFMVNSNQLNRVKAVYVDEKGSTSVSSDLRAGEKRPSQTQSIYPVHAALGLSVSDAILQGCYAVIVEGPSDQIYLSAIKNYLIGKGLITPNREVVFIPSGGVKGIQAVVSIMAGKNQSLPFCILDGDQSGQGLSRKLKESIYMGQEDRVLLMNEILSLENAEIEDLLSGQFLSVISSNFLPRPEDTENDFIDIYKDNLPILPQIEDYAKLNGIELQRGWKVELAKRAKVTLSKNRTDIEQKFIDKWKEIFDKIQIQ